MKTSSIQNKIKELEDKLSEIKEMHKAQWYTCGSELSAGDMLNKEEKIENEINKLKELL